MSKNEDGLDHIRIPFEKLKFGNKLEVQGYGTIYEGEFDGRKVALKRLNTTNLANVKQKLLDEILTISEFRHHPNLVALLGFCDEKSNEIVMVYEFVGSGNLAEKMRKRLNTIQRLEICLGAARGLEYLHIGVDSTKHGIVHGNIKPSKILLNSNNLKLEAKVSSFGLSKIVPGSASIKSEEDIEKKSKESDVYDFGVLLLEVLCGVSELVDTDDYQEKHVTELVPKRLEQDKVRKIVHFDIRKEIKTEALETYAKIACQCVTENVEARPTMGKVVEELEKALILQGGEVTYVEIIGSKNTSDTQEEIVVEDGLDVDMNSPIIEQDMNDLIVDDKLDVSGEDNRDKINIVDATLDSTNGEKNTLEDVMTAEPSSHVPVLVSVEGESVSDSTETEDAQKESSNNEPKTTEGDTDDSNSNSKSNINEEANQNSCFTAEAQIETTEDIINESNSNEISNISAQNEDDNQNRTETKDAPQEEISNNQPETREVIMDDLNLNIAAKKEVIEDAQHVNNIKLENTHKESSVAVKDAYDDQTITDAQKEISNTSTNDPDTIQEIKETKNGNHSTNIDPIFESNKIDTSTSDHSTNQDVQNTVILETGSREFNNLQDGNHDKESADELQHLRIPFDRIKFGEKIDGHGYGSMFEGEFDDQQVALKRLNITNLGNIKPKLLSEILTISKFRRHPNVVALIGFCDEKTNEIVVVYEYVSNGKLSDKMSKHLTTIQRLEICLGSARGLEYLHTGVNESTPGIIHGDIKLSKILLNWDSNSSKFEAKVSGFGLSKLLPGDVQSAKKSTVLTKEYDVYCFGVLLLEVLCGVPELVDTDDYQERHVTELVPKRLEQNMLRKIVHFDIRNEIKTESLETYAKIACRCVTKESEDMPTMAEVVIELEKALRLQGGEVDDIQILDSSNGNGLPKDTEDKGVQEVGDNAEKMGSDIAEEGSELKTESIEDIATIEQSSDIPILGSENVSEITQIKGGDKENGENKEQLTVDQKSNEEPKISGEDGNDQENKIVTYSESNDETKEKDNDGPEIMDDKITTMEITTVQEVQEPAILDSDNTKHLTLLNAGKKAEMVVNNREGDFSDFATLSVEITKESESKRSNSTCSESSNTTPSDYLLPKSPATLKKTSDGSKNCCSCSWWRYISDRIVFYGGQFWNKMVACFTWIKGQFSSKND